MTLEESQKDYTGRKRLTGNNGTSGQLLCNSTEVLEELKDQKRGGPTWHIRPRVFSVILGVLYQSQCCPRFPENIPICCTDRAVLHCCPLVPPVKAD